MNIFANLKNLDQVVISLNQIIQTKKNFPCILLQGEMGSGKTTFVRKYLQTLEPSVNVNSPTFNLIHEYHIQEKKYFHFDLYRIKHKEELTNLGFEEIWSKEGICFIEWFEIAKDFFTENDILLKIETISKNKRKYTLETWKIH